MSDADIDKKISATRRDLERALDEIGDKLNPKKQAGILASKARVAFKEHPVPFIVSGTAAVIVTAGLIAWAALSGDDD